MNDDDVHVKISQPKSPDEQLKQYTSNPWDPAFYSQFDDLEPGARILHISCIDDIPGMRGWFVPVIGIKKMIEPGRQSYEQVKMGYLEITECPNGDGTSELLISIREPATS
jgi:hypothetical protein